MDDEGDPHLSLFVLGFVRVTRAGAELELGSPQRRAALALLMAGAGRPVALEVFVDALWRDAPPPTAANIVHRLISGLRQVLEPGRAARAPSRWIARAGAGYQLTGAPESLDLVRFRGHVERARALTGEAAVRAYADGLALWHGRAGQGIDPAVRSHPQIAALDREWVAAARAGVDRALEAGAAEAMLPAIVRVAEAEPLDETVHARLILVLAATGRRAAALTAYREVRARLRHDLGVPPGPELEEAHRRVLSAPGAAGPAVASPPAVTTQLPAELATFTGRSRELAQLTALAARPAAGPAPPIVISGMGGVGKTALAVRWAQQAAAHFPHGRLYADLHGYAPSGQPAEVTDVLRDFLAALGVRDEELPRTPEARSTRYRRLLADRRMIVLIDNAADAAQVRPLLPGAPGCVALVTSRNPLTALIALDGARSLTLGVFPADQARALLLRKLGRARLDAEPEAAARLVALSGRLPLALAIVAARAAVNPGFRLAALADEIESEEGLDAFATSAPDLDVRSVFSWSYHTLPPAAARLFRLLATHPGPDATAATAAAAAGTTVREARALLADLVRAQLVTERAPGRYCFHDLLRAYAVELAAREESPRDREAALERMLDYYLRTAAALAARLSPHRPPIDVPPPAHLPAAGPDAAREWFDAERDALLAAAQLETRQPQVGQFAWALTPYLQGP